MDTHLAAPLPSVADSLAPISRQIWDMKYRFKGPDGTPIDPTIEDTWRRVARALAEAEAEPGALGTAVLRGAGGLPVPAGRPHPGRRRHRPPRDAVQLLRHGRRSPTTSAASSPICARPR